MRQSAQQVELEPTWRQEVNRRIAEHRGRKAASATGQQNSSEPQHAPGSLAAKAAARVAARYAKAPSYSEMLADEARAAVRAAEAASRAALEAQAVAESVLAGLEAQSSARESWESDLFGDPEPAPAWVSNPNSPRSTQAPLAPPRVDAASQAPAAHSRSRPTKPQSYEIRWDTDLPVREPSPARASHGAASFEAPTQDSWGRAQNLPTQLETEGFELVEPAQPIHANLIEFPRELVATRKVRPRRAEGPYAQSVEAPGQLSIFEVDPGSISIDVPTGAAVAAASTVIGPRWSGIELDEEPEQEELAAPAPQSQPAVAAAAAAAAAALPAPALEFALAPTHQRLMAALVDFSLISASFLAAALAASTYAKVLPPIREIEAGSALALALIAILYQAVFSTLARATPGMKYARLELLNFAGQKPARAQRCARMAALPLSLLPMGLGIVWSLFDDQHLCWHDRLSKTYLRKA